jgi:MFS family permease
VTIALQNSSRAIAGPLVVISALGIGQIFAWGSSYYLLAVLAKPIAAGTGWSLTWIVGGLSIGLIAASIVSPRVGRTIERHGGRFVLAASTILLAAGLMLLAVAETLSLYLFGWLIVGLGMGAGLYDPAFATLGCLYGKGARSAITVLTLFGGFASTVCWPLSAFLVAHAGWRGTCLTYAAFHLAVLLPLYLVAVPNGEGPAVSDQRSDAASSGDAAAPGIVRAGLLFGMLAVAITVSSMISTLVSVHLITVLQSRGVSLAAAVALGALVGPSQVCARLIELVIARYHHPIWTKLVSTCLVALGLALLWTAVPVLAVPLVFYGAGIGLESRARGTLPLAMFAGPGYAARMGRLAMPSLMAQAAAPSIGAVLLDGAGVGGTLTALVLVAVGNFLLGVMLFVGLRCWRPAHS